MRTRAPAVGQNHFAEMIGDIGGIHRAADLLEVHPTTIKRWITGRAPRAAILALYWETPTGRSQVETEAANLERWLRLQILALQNDNDRLKAALQSVSALSTGAANDPAARVLNRAVS